MHNLHQACAQYCGETCTFYNSHRRIKNILKSVQKGREQGLVVMGLALVQLPESVIVSLHLVHWCDQGELESSQYREFIQKQLLG